MNTATKLPSQVQKISEATEILAVKSGMTPGSKPVEQRTPVQRQTEPTKIDPADYKTRYSNYKKATDETITGLRQTLADVQATLADVQRQNQALINERSSAPVAPIKPVEAANSVKSTAITRNDPEYKAYLDNLPESVKKEYEEDYLFDQFVIQRSISQVSKKSDNNEKDDVISRLEQKVDSVVQFNERTRTEIYNDEMDAAFPNDEWIVLSNGDQWADFCSNRISDIDSRTFGQVAQEGNDTLDSKKVIWVLNEYKRHLSSLSQSASDPLAGQLTPEGSGGGDPINEINAQAESFTVSQVNQFFSDVTKGKYTPEEAKSIEASITAANAAGKILPG